MQQQLPPYVCPRFISSIWRSTLGLSLRILQNVVFAVALFAALSTFLLVAPAQATPERHDIAFIENNLADYQTLVARAKQRGMETVVLDSRGDGLVQMVEYLAQKVPGSVEAIHLLSHGSSGAIHLGALTLSSSNLQQNRDTLARIGSALKTDGDVLVYGCNVAEGQVGVEFVGRLAQATGADVAASDDPTGASWLGGDWELEKNAGNVTSSALNETAYGGALSLVGAKVWSEDAIFNSTVQDAADIVNGSTELDPFGPFTTNIETVDATHSVITLTITTDSWTDSDVTTFLRFTGGVLNRITAVSIDTQNSTQPNSAAISVQVNQTDNKVIDFAFTKANATITKPDGSISWNVSDGGQIVINVTSEAIATAPTLNNLSSDTLTYTVGSGAVVIDQGTAATVTDGDSANFDTGVLTVTGIGTGDLIQIRNQGTGAGQIGVSGSNISYAGTTIGTYTGGQASNLAVTFNANATPTAVSALLQNLTYRNDFAEAASSHTLSITVSDGDGGTSTAASVTVNAAPASSANASLLIKVGAQSQGSMGSLGAYNAATQLGTTNVIDANPIGFDGMASTFPYFQDGFFMFEGKLYGMFANPAQSLGYKFGRFDGTQVEYFGTQAFEGLNNFAFGNGKIYLNASLISNGGSRIFEFDVSSSTLTTISTATPGYDAGIQYYNGKLYYFDNSNYSLSSWDGSTVTNVWSAHTNAATFSNNMVVMNGELYFGAEQPAVEPAGVAKYYKELFKYNATTNSITQLTNRSGTSAVWNETEMPKYLTVFGNKVYFSGSNSSNTTLDDSNDRWLVSVDSSGNVVTEYNPGSATGGADGEVSGIWSIGGNLYFAAKEGAASYYNAYKYNSTGSVTKLSSFNTGTISIVDVNGYGSDVYFTVNDTAATNTGLYKVTGSTVAKVTIFPGLATTGEAPEEFDAGLVVFSGQIAPVVSNTLDLVGMVAGGSTPVATALTVTDVDSANITGATVTITSGKASGDSLSFTPANGITGSYDSGTGVLTLTGTTTAANYQSVLRGVTFTSGSSAGQREFRFKATDSDGNQTWAASPAGIAYIAVTGSTGSVAMTSFGTDPTAGGTVGTVDVANASLTNIQIVADADTTNGTYGLSYDAASQAITVTTDYTNLTQFKIKSANGAEFDFQGLRFYDNALSVIVDLTFTGFKNSAQTAQTTLNVNAGGPTTTLVLPTSFDDVDEVVVTLGANAVTAMGGSAIGGRIDDILVLPATSGSVFTVSFNNNGGTGTMTAQTANVSTALTANSFTRSGYTFAGWSTTSGGSVVYADGATYAFTADITLYAQWTALPTKTVTFNNNGGTGTMTAQTANVATNLTTNTFTRSGYTFAGWNTVAGGGGTAYADGASYAFTADITLYAQWTALPTKTVTFNNNGGTGTMTAQTANVATNLTTNTFTRSGYTFAGWNTVAGGGGTAYADGASYAFTADITLYAQWTAASLTAQTIGAIGFSPNALIVNQTSTASAIATSGLTVTFSSLTPSICTVSGSTVTGVAAGVCTIAADQAGNATYGVAPQVTQNITVAATANAAHLTHGGSTTDYTTIQLAVDAAVDGDTITLDAGTFVEQVTITKVITLQGAGIDQTIIRAPTSASLTQSGGNWKNLKDQDIYAIVGIKTTSAGTTLIKNLTVDGNDQGFLNTQYPSAAYSTYEYTYDFEGVGVFNSSATIDTVKVTGARALSTSFGNTVPAGYLPQDQPAGNNHNSGIFAESAASAGSHTVTVKNSTITKYQRTGILAWGPTLTVDINNNTFQGYGQTYYSRGNAIQIAGTDRSSYGGANGDRRGTTGSIINNQMLNIGIVIPAPGQTGSYLDLNYGAPSGVILWQAGNAFQITGNTMTGPVVSSWHNNATSSDGGYGNTGIDVYGSVSAVANNNTISGFDVGIVEEGTVAGSHFSASGNTFANNGVDLWSASGNDQITLGSGAEIVAFGQTGNGIDTVTGFGVGDKINVIGFVTGSVNGLIGTQPINIVDVEGHTVVNGYTDGHPVVDFTGGTVSMGDGSSVAAKSVQLAASGGNTTLYIDTDGVAGSAELQINLVGTYTPSNFALSGGYISYVSSPGAPIIMGITPGNAQLSVAFTAGVDGGTAITNYEYSTNNGGAFTAVSPAVTTSPIVITGLTNGTTYQVQIRAVNAVGSGVATASTSGTPATTPSAPTITGITPGNAQLSVAFTAGATGGSAITNYEYSTNNGGAFTAVSPAATTSPIVVTGLTNGISYQVQIRAVNAVGAGAATASTAATPNPVVNGTCGSANGVTIAYAPTPATLCSLGSASAVTNNASSWGWTCTGSGGGGTASCTAPKTQTTTGTGAGSLEITTSSGPTAWQVQSANFVSVASTGSSAPAGYSFPHGLLDLRLNTGTAGTSATVTITYPQALPVGTVYWKYGKEPAPGNQTPHWYIFPGAVISGNTVTLTIFDGQQGDDDLTANSLIADPGGPAAPLGAGGATSIPTLSQWGQIVLSGLLVLLGLVGLGRRKAAFVGG